MGSDFLNYFMLIFVKSLGSLNDTVQIVYLIFVLDGLDMILFQAAVALLVGLLELAYFQHFNLNALRIIQRVLIEMISLDFIAFAIRNELRRTR